MNSFLFTWNPRRWSWDNLPQAVYEANAEGMHRDWWNCGSTRYIDPGDRAFLMRLGVRPKGIMGSGVVVSKPYQGPHYDPQQAEQGALLYRVDIIFDVLSETPILGEDILSDKPLGEHKWTPKASGTHIPEGIIGHLESIWSHATGTTFEPPGPDDIPNLLHEGTKRSRQVTMYERNPAARKECIQHYGTSCQTCGLAFQEHYGDIGEGFIHVHHLVPMSEIGAAYEVDPVNDLRPVCPNCHAMLHKRIPPYTIEELRAMMIALNDQGEETQ